MAVPFAPLFVAPRVMPQGTANVLGNLIAGWDAGQQVFQERKADEAFADYTNGLMQGQPPPGGGATLGNLVQPQAYTAPVTPVTRQPLPPVGPSVGSAMPGGNGYSLGGQIGAPLPSNPSFAGFDTQSVVNSIIQSESGGDPNARNPYGSATGLGQFIDSTWLSMLEQYRPDLLAGRTRQQALDLRYDPALSTEMTQRAVEGYASTYQAAGVPITPGSLYMAHFLGPQGAIDFLSRNPATPVETFLPPDVIAANQAVLAGQTVGDVMAWADRRMGQDGPMGAVQRMAQSPAAQAAQRAYSAGAAPTPFSPQEMGYIQTLAADPRYREYAFSEIQRRMAQTATPEYGFQEVGGVLYATNPQTGQAMPVAGNQAPPEPPPTHELIGPDGRTYLMGWNPATGQFDMPLGVTDTPEAAGGEPPTDIQYYDYYVQQETAAGRTPLSFNEWDLERRGRLGGIDPTVAEQRYGLLYENAARELPIIEETFAALTNLGDQTANLLPSVLGNWLVSPEYQRALSSMTQIVQMQTYALTGAAATESEAQRIARTLLPAIGDQPPVIADKLQRVRDAVESIRRAAGPAGAAIAPLPGATAIPNATPADPLGFGY